MTDKKSYLQLKRLEIETGQINQNQSVLVKRTLQFQNYRFKINVQKRKEQIQNLMNHEFMLFSNKMEYSAPSYKQQQAYQFSNTTREKLQNTEQIQENTQVQECNDNLKTKIPKFLVKQINLNNHNIQKKEIFQIRADVDSFYKNQNKTSSRDKQQKTQNLRQKLQKIREINELKNNEIENIKKVVSQIQNESLLFNNSMNSLTKSQKKQYFESFMILFQKSSQAGIFVQNKFEIYIEVIKNEIKFNKISKSVNQRILDSIGITQNSIKIDFPQYTIIQQLKEIYTQSEEFQILFILNFFFFDEQNCDKQKVKMIIRMMTQQLQNVSFEDDKNYQHFIQLFQENKIYSQEGNVIEKSLQIFLQENIDIVQVFLRLIFNKK